MNQITPPPKIEIIPSSAPFSEAQRTWLNGFFAGLLTETVTPLSAEQGAAVMKGPAGDSDDGAAPWHDQTMPISDRMKLAEGRPLRRRMMAAMAQQDCGQCGYNCHDYSEAIASKAEARLNLCVPGGKETARMLKTLHEELDKAPAATPDPAATPVAPAAVSFVELGRSRDNPTPRDVPVAALAQQERLGKGNLAHRVRSCRKRPRLRGWRLLRHFRPNELGHVDQVIALLGASHTTEVRGRTLARRPDRRSLARARTGFAVRTDLLHHRRRPAREGARVGAGR